MLADIVDKGTFDRTDCYNTVVRSDGGFDGLLTVPFRERGHVGLMAIERPRTKPDYERRDADMLQALLPHLSNALQILLKLEDSAETTRQAFAAFDFLEFDVIVVDDRMRPVFMNSRAERIVVSSHCLSVGKDGLQAARADQTQMLRSIIHAAIVTGNARRRDDTDNQSLPLDGTAVEVAFGLTPRQAALAVLLARGKSLPQAAAALSITLETARSHLKEVFFRTNTRRQADLIRVIAWPLPRSRRAAGRRDGRTALTTFCALLGLASRFNRADSNPRAAETIWLICHRVCGSIRLGGWVRRVLWRALACVFAARHPHVTFNHGVPGSSPGVLTIFTCDFNRLELDQPLLPFMMCRRSASKSAH